MRSPAGGLSPPVASPWAPAPERALYNMVPHAPGARTRTPRRLHGISQPSADISFLADAVSHKSHGGHPPLRPSTWGGTQNEWSSFQRSLDAKRLAPVHAKPAMSAPYAERPPPATSPATSPWASRGFAQTSVASLLFPAEAQQVEDIVAGLTAPRAPPATATGSPRRAPSRAMTPNAPPLKPPSSPRTPARDPVRLQPEMLDMSARSEPSGRAQAVRLATALAAEVGPCLVDPGAPDGAVPAALSDRAAAAISVPTDPGSLVHNHAELLALTEIDIVPHLDALDRAAQQLVNQVGGHCSEQAILVEYLRRHQLAAAGTARALLQRLQHTVNMYEELRQAMDGSLLQKFQDSLGDAFAAVAMTQQPPAARPPRTPSPSRSAGTAPAPLA